MAALFFLQPSAGVRCAQLVDTCRLRGKSLDDRTLGVLSIRVAVGNQGGEFLAQITKLPDAGIDETQLGRGELPRGVTRAPRLRKIVPCRSTSSTSWATTAGSR